MKMKEWMVSKIKEEMHGGFIVEINGIEKETEKAYLLNITWGYSSDLEKTISHWCPKSATMTEEQALAEEKAESKRYENGLAYNESLVLFAKENGIKGIRLGMRTSTLLTKIVQAGLQAPARA